MSIRLTTLAIPAQLIICSESNGIDNKVELLWVGLGWNGQAKKCGYNLCAENYAELNTCTVYIIIVNTLYKYYSVG